MSEVAATDLRRVLAVRVALRVPAAMALFAVVVFLPAGTFYWEGALYLGTILTCSLSLTAWLLAYEPDVLDRRLRIREKQEKQKHLIRLGFVSYLAAFMLPGLDHRFGWSSVPPAVVIASDVLIFAGFILFFVVVRENRWASRVIEIEEGQQVVTTGPYAIVRHPMYVSAIAIYLFSPLALGSWWSVPAVIPLVWVIVARIRNEEEVLTRELNGYGDYLKKVRYRLIPGVW